MIPKEANNTGGAPIPHSGQSGRGVQLGTAVRFALKGPRPGVVVLRLANGMHGHIDPFFNFAIPIDFFFCFLTQWPPFYNSQQIFDSLSPNNMTTFHQTFIF